MPYVFFGEAGLSLPRGARHGMMSRNPAELSAAPMFRGERRDVSPYRGVGARRGKSVDAQGSLKKSESRLGSVTLLTYVLTTAKERKKKDDGEEEKRGECGVYEKALLRVTTKSILRVYPHAPLPYRLHT